MSKKLDAREKRFVDEYLVDLDPQRAAVAAGYATTTARTKSYQWVSNSEQKPHVYEAIQKALEKRSNRTEITADRVLRELALLGFANMEDYVRIGTNGDPYIDLSKLTREQAAALSEIAVDDYVEGRGKNARDVRKVRIKFHDKKGALVDIGKHLGMFKERVEHTGKDGGPIEHKELDAMPTKKLLELLELIRGDSAKEKDSV